MTERDPGQPDESLYDETPGSQGEIEAGSEGDFNGPDTVDEPADHDGDDEADASPT